jgi:hypothetical protein
MRVFRQTFMGNDGNVRYGPEEVIDAGPFDHPGLGSFVQLEDGWYRLRRKEVRVAEVRVYDTATGEDVSDQFVVGPAEGWPMPTGVESPDLQRQEE